MSSTTIFRGVAFEFREHAKHPRVWTFAFGGGSLVAALCQGFALGGLIEGPKIHDGRFVGGPFDWLSPFTMLVACGVVCGYVLLGSTYLIIKTKGVQQRRTYRPAWIAGALMLMAAAAISVWTPVRYPFVADKWFGHGLLSIVVVPPLFAILCATMLARGLWKNFEHSPFIWSVGIFLASFTGLAASLYPFIMPNAVTAMDAAADSMTLVFMLVGIGMLIPVMLAYNAYQYFVFRGKVTASLYADQRPIKNPPM